MIFYKYTINKMFRSVSTYITGIFGVLPILILGILAMTGNGVGYQYTSLVSLITFPLFVVYITFKTIQVFRNEIENQTMLTIVSKPFPRRKLVLEGLLALLTMIAILSFVGIFIPMLGYLRTETNIGEVFVKDILVTLTTILLGSIVASLGLLMSLKMKGKSFIGVMLAIFGIAFYALWGTMTGLRFATSRGLKVNNYNQGTVLVQGTDVADGKVYNEEGVHINGKYITYDITDKAPSYYQGTGGATETAEDVYKKFQDLSHFKVMDFVKWIDPTLHWQVLYNGASSVGTGDISPFKIVTSGKDVDIDIRKVWTDTDSSGVKHYYITMKAETESAVPIYYPILLWLVIGGVVVGLTFRTLSKANIS